MPGKSLSVRTGDAINYDVRIEHAGQMPTLVDRSLRRIFERIWRGLAWTFKRLSP